MAAAPRRQSIESIRATTAPATGGQHDANAPPPAESRPASYFATVPAGVETVAVDDIRERIEPDEIEIRRGKVCFATDRPFGDLRTLRSVFRIFAFVTCVSDVPLDDRGPAHLKDLCDAIDWTPALRIWRRIFPDLGHRPRFRVTVRRDGDHAYDSMQAASAIGAGFQRRFGWPVDLGNPDLDIFAQLRDADGLIGLTLTGSSLHYDSGLLRGRAGLRGPVAYALVRLANVRTGETCLDPMCGVATIPIEAAVRTPDATFLAGDIDDAAVEAAAENVRRTATPIIVQQWDVAALPLDDASVDVIVTDMPFGRRVGSHRRNRTLYPLAMQEFARVLRPGGRAILMTLERRLMNHVLDRDDRWTVTATRNIYYGGLGPKIYELTRGS